MEKIYHWRWTQTKVGFVVVMHKSELRPNGFNFISGYIRTLYKYCKEDFILYLFDNQSDEKYNVPNHKNIRYEYIEDQFKRGLVGPANDGVNRAIEDGCDIVIFSNDDILFNETINDFIKIIENHKHKDVGLYGPLSNGVFELTHQYALEHSSGIIEITKEYSHKGIIRGFFISFTKEFYEKFRLPNGNLFRIGGKWRRGEIFISNQIIPFGGRIFVIKDCWIFHHKTKGVTRLIRKMRKNESKSKTKNPVRRKRASRK